MNIDRRSLVKAGLYASAEFDSATAGPFEIYTCPLVNVESPFKAAKASKAAKPAKKKARRKA